jgi:ribonuclease P protein component
LSTEQAENSTEPVDKLSGMLLVGIVVPKRHARRAVTRSLLKRQIRAAFERHAAALPGGLWLVRLRSPFAPREFPSAASAALAGAARAELDHLLRRLCRAADDAAAAPA